MGEFRWINKTLFLILVLQFTAVTGQTTLSFTVRAGDDVTLPCGNVINSQDKCSSTSWLSSRSLGKTAEELISLGQISNNVIGKAKSNRLSVTADCSLVIKKVTGEDAGRYSCRQFDESGQQQGPDALVHLSVINMTERQSDILVILFCSVLAYEGLANEECEHTVKWLYEGNKSDVEISPSTCSSTLRFTPHLNQKSKYYESLKCNVTDKKNGETLLCDVGPQSSCEKTAVTGQTPLSFTVRAGDDVTLPCVNVMNSQDKCCGTSWLSSRSLGETAEELISHGQISNNVIGKAKSDRLSVTADCSLVIKKVTRDDVGRYSCRQFDESGEHGADAHVFLSVINMTEHESDVLVILYCSVLTYEGLANEGCEHTVQWLYEGNKSDVEISPHTCSAIVRLPPHPNQKSKYYESLKCNVTDKKNGETLLCDVGPQSSCEKTGSTSAGRNNTTSAPKQGWWRYIIVSVGLATLIISVVTVNIWKRTKGSHTKMEDDAVHHDEAEGTVTYENVGEPSASIRLD